MESTSCSGLILLSVVMILLALECSTAMGIRDSTTTKYVSLQNDAGFLWGRKMLQGLDQNIKDQNEMFKQMGDHKSQGSRILTTVDDHHHSQNPTPQVTSSPKDNVVQTHDHYIPEKNDDSAAFLEAADEIINLIHRDYHRAARKKPPINNNEPKN